MSRQTGKMIVNTVLSRSVDVETARTERSVTIEEAFCKVSGSSRLMGVIIIAITSVDAGVVIVSMVLTTAFVVSAIDDGIRRGRGAIGDGGSRNVILIIYFTVGSRTVPIARGHPSARWGTDTIVVYLVSY